jgi:hypothetical protein
MAGNAAATPRFVSGLIQRPALPDSVTEVSVP